MKSFKQHLLSEKVFDQKNKWVEDSVDNMDDAEEEKLWDMFFSTYKDIGLIYKSKHELMQDSKGQLILGVDNNEDPTEDLFVLMKKTKFGLKMVLAGTDGSNESKTGMISKMISLLNGSGYYIEASGVLGAVLLKRGAKIVTERQTVEKVLEGKKIDWKGDGKYVRDITGIGKKEKTMFGNPRV